MQSERSYKDEDKDFIDKCTEKKYKISGPYIIPYKNFRVD